MMVNPSSSGEDNGRFKSIIMVSDLRQKWFRSRSASPRRTENNHSDSRAPILILIITTWHFYQELSQKRLLSIELMKYFLIILSAIILSIPAMSFEGIVGWNQLIRSEHRLLQAIVDIDQFEFEVKNVVAEASTLHNGIHASVVEFNYGSNAVIAKVCFADGICWAAKMMENCPLSERITWFATEALTLVD